MSLLDIDTLLDYLSCPTKSDFDWSTRSKDNLQQVQYINDIFFDIYKYCIENLLLSDKVQLKDVYTKLNLIWDSVRGKIGLNNKLSIQYRIKNLHAYVSDLEVLYYNIPRTINILDKEIYYNIHVFKRRSTGEKITSFTSTVKYYRDRVSGRSHIDLILSLIKDDIQSIPQLKDTNVVVFYPFNSIEDNVKYINNSSKYLESFIKYINGKNKLPPARPPCEFCGFKDSCIWSKNLNE